MATTPPPLTRLSVSPPQLHVTAHRTSFFFFPFLFFKWVRFRRWAEQPRVAAKKPQPGASRGDYSSIPPCTTHSKYGHCFQCFSLYCCHLSHLAPPLPLPLLSGWLLCWCSCPLLMPKEKWPWSKSDRRNRCAPPCKHTHTHSLPRLLASAQCISFCENNHHCRDKIYDATGT